MIKLLVRKGAEDTFIIKKDINQVLYVLKQVRVTALGTEQNSTYFLKYEATPRTLL